MHITYIFVNEFIPEIFRDIFYLNLFQIIFHRIKKKIDSKLIYETGNLLFLRTIRSWISRFTPSILVLLFLKIGNLI